jgi:hypothetical protein
MRDKTYLDYLDVKREDWLQSLRLASVIPCEGKERITMKKPLSVMLLAFGTLPLFAGSISRGSSMKAKTEGRDVTPQLQEQNPSAATSSTKSDMHDMPGMSADGSMLAAHTMEGHHMDMGPHMKMTSLRELKPGDQEKADAVVRAARKVVTTYTDYRVALADGYEIFLPNVPQTQYHFNNRSYALEARRVFNPNHPTSLLYEKQDDGYKVIGVMYTAPKDASADDLNSRIPLSITQWHAHVNLCLPPGDKKDGLTSPSPRFGLTGSITTKQACDAANGNFVPQIFGWMVHVYPFEQNPKDVWSVERQAHSHME